MFRMTSFGAKVDDSVNSGKGPYVFKVSGQIYHWIGSLCPEEGQHPRFLQLYIYDTHDEVSNRMRNFASREEDMLNPDIVQGYTVPTDITIRSRLFRTARDRCNAGEIPGFKIRLYNNGGAREYELPGSDVLGGIVFEDGPQSRTDFDVIIEFRGGFPKRINKLHQSYMSLQFPLLFKFESSVAFQQYVVATFCAIEQSRLDFILKRQRELRSDYLLGLYDVISQGDREGIQAGSMVMLPRTFTGGPRIVPSYVDALSYMFPGLTPADRADIVCRVFQQKMNDFLRFLKDERPFGYVIAFLYTIEFQKRGLPHCHTLLWVDSSNQIKEAAQIDDYISAELPDPIQDPVAYKVVTELMMHGPCGVANSSAVGNPSSSTIEKHIQVDEIKNYVDGRFICLFEACWRIFDYPIHRREPAMQILNVHLENMQRVNFGERDSSGDLFYFRMLLSYKKGCKSPIEVRTMNGASATSAQLRTLFAQILVYCNVADPRKLWEKHWEAMKDDIPGKVSQVTGILNYHLNTPELQGHILYELEATLNGFGKSVKEFGLPTPPEHLLKDLKNKLLMEEKNYKRDVLLQESALLVPKLNTKQKQIYTLNMRLFRSGLSDEERERSKLFAEWLLDVGNGEIGYPDKDYGEDTFRITVPQEYCIAPGEQENLNKITFPDSPPHEYTKGGIPNMLLRNVNLQEAYAMYKNDAVFPECQSDRSARYHHQEQE
ncbi:DNA helicase [Tanacetum coccineum]